MPVDRADIEHAHFFEQRAGNNHIFDAVFHAVDEIFKPRHARKAAARPFFQKRIAAAFAHMRQRPRHRADVRRDRHGIVIQNHDQVVARIARIVDALVDHTVAERAVADDRHDMFVAAAKITRPRKPERRGNGHARMSRAEGIVFAFGDDWKTAGAAAHAKTAHGLHSARQNFMGIALMADIEDDLVMRAIKARVKRDRQFHRAEVRGKMPARLRHGLYDILPDLVAERRKLRVAHAF